MHHLSQENRKRDSFWTENSKKFCAYAIEAEYKILLEIFQAFF